MDESLMMPRYLLSGHSLILFISRDFISWIPAWFRGSEHSTVPPLMHTSSPAFSSSWATQHHVPSSHQRRGREEQPGLGYHCLLMQHFTFRKHLSNLHSTQWGRLVLELQR